jgi:hypothetical protein
MPDSEDSENVLAEALPVAASVQPIMPPSASRAERRDGSVMLESGIARRGPALYLLHPHRRGSVHKGEPGAEQPMVRCHRRGFGRRTGPLR